MATWKAQGWLPPWRERLGLPVVPGTEAPWPGSCCPPELASWASLCPHRAEPLCVLTFWVSRPLCGVEELKIPVLPPAAWCRTSPTSFHHRLRSHFLGCLLPGLGNTLLIICILWEQLMPSIFLLLFLFCPPSISLFLHPCPHFSFFLSMPPGVPTWLTISVPTGPWEPYGQCQQPHESRRQPHGVRHDHQQPRPQLPTVCWAAAAVLSQGWPCSALHPAGNVWPAQLPWQRGLRGQVSRLSGGNSLEKWYVSHALPLQPGEESNLSPSAMLPGLGHG